MQDFAKRFYRSKAWKACRAAYIARRLAIDGGLCEECRDQQGYIVHHRVTLTPENIHNPAIALNHSLLAYVCKDCHEELHPESQRPFRRTHAPVTEERWD